MPEIPENQVVLKPSINIRHEQMYSKNTTIPEPGICYVLEIPYHYHCQNKFSKPTQH